MVETGVNSFTFSEAYYRAIGDSENGLSDEQKARLYKAIIDYIFANEYPQFKGVMKLVFTAILPSLELSKKRSKAKQNKNKTKSNENQNENKSKSNENQNENKSKSNENQNENKTETNQNQNENKSKSKFTKEEKREKAAPLEKERSKEKEYIPPEKEKREESPSVLNELGRDIEQDERTKRQQEFFALYPEIVIDNYSASDYADIDFSVLLEEFSLSKKILQKMKSFSWICSNYRRIENGSFRDWAEDKPQAERSTAEKNAEWYDKSFGAAGV